MALEQIQAHFGRAFSLVNTGRKPSLKTILQELQGLKMVAVSGAAANTNIAIAGIKTEDTIVGVANVSNDNNPAFTITSDGNIQSADSTDADSLIVLWFDKNP